MLVWSKETLGRDHPYSLTAMNNLALALSCHGKWEEAESMRGQAIAGNERVLGDNHVNTLTSVNSLADLLSLRGRFEEATLFYERARTG